MTSSVDFIAELKRFCLVGLAGLGPFQGGFAENLSTTVSPQSLLGKYGFDWLKPETAKCEEVVESLAKTLMQCKVAGIASFTGKTGHFVCKIQGGEFFIYPTEERCQEELKTMQANGP